VSAYTNSIKEFPLSKVAQDLIIIGVESNTWRVSSKSIRHKPLFKMNKPLLLLVFMMNPLEHLVVYVGGPDK
jgi:hypothetical protein